MTLVIDASVAVAACFRHNGVRELGDERLAAPSLMWFEAHSVLHEMVWRGELSRDAGELMRSRLETLAVERRDADSLSGEAWRLADELGWAKTYDASYLALARTLRARLVTLDGRLRRGADRLGFVVGPTEL